MKKKKEDKEKEEGTLKPCGPIKSVNIRPGISCHQHEFRTSCSKTIIIKIIYPIL